MKASITLIISAFILTGCMGSSSETITSNNTNKPMNSQAMQKEQHDTNEESQVVEDGSATTDENLTEVTGGYQYVLQENDKTSPFKKTTLNKVCFEPAQMDTFNEGNLFCFTNTQEALNMLGINEMDDTCQYYWGIATVQVKNLTGNASYQKGDPCVASGDCMVNEAELVSMEPWKGELPQCEK